MGAAATDNAHDRTVANPCHSKLDAPGVGDMHTNACQHLLIQATAPLLRNGGGAGEGEGGVWGRPRYLLAIWVTGMVPVSWLLWTAK